MTAFVRDVTSLQALYLDHCVRRLAWPPTPHPTRNIEELALRQSSLGGPGKCSQNQIGREAQTALKNNKMNPADPTEAGGTLK